ncbi:hypothetical protein ACQ4PT_041687 [Festuca glaucescens]
MEEVENSSKRKAAELDSEDNSTAAVPDGQQPLPCSATKRPNLARSCIHEVAVPNGYDLAKDEVVNGTLSNPVFNGEMAKTDKQKVIYTSPLKALSNQKYRELSQEFSDVGLMTGDVTLQPNATCLVMTTEILRAMLYRGSEVIKEVGWVIFDEIHYMKDRERGVVWEESIVFLPPAIKMVFLSATMSNATEFAEWICNLHKQPCHVVYTDFRPTPLQHYVFPIGGFGLYLVVDENGQFREDNFLKLQDTFAKQPSQLDGRKGGGPKANGRIAKGGNASGTSDIYIIVKVGQDEFWPYFVFTSVKKWDGDSNRYIGSGEYIQMSGRAGHRGKDKRGICVIMIDEKMEMSVIKDMVLGKPAPLISTFRLSYYTILNLLSRAEGQFTAEHVIQNSFHQFQYEKALPEVVQKITSLENEASLLDSSGENDLAEYHKLVLDISELEKKIMSEMIRRERALLYLVPGRLVKVRDGSTDWGWGVVVNVVKKPAASSTLPPALSASRGNNYIVDTLLHCSSSSNENGSRSKPCPPRPGEKGEMHVVPVPLPLVSGLSSVRINIPSDLRPPEARQNILSAVQELGKCYPQGLPNLHPIAVKILLT